MGHLMTTKGQTEINPTSSPRYAQRINTFLHHSGARLVIGA